MKFFNIKNRTPKFYSAVITSLLLVFIFGLQLSAQVTEDVTFKVTTSSPDGKYSPKNIGAIWIENASGDFVKTLKLWADRRKQYLYTWNSASGGNTVDAITGSTKSSHGTHQASWDLTDKNGNRVADGEYSLIVEMTDEHSQGPLATFTFPVGAASNTLTPGDKDYFHNIELSWNSTVTIIKDDAPIVNSFSLDQNYPNPFNPSTSIRYILPENSDVVLSIYDIVGKKVATIVNQQQSAGEYTVNFNAAGLTSGVYLYKLTAGKFSETRKMYLVK